MREAIGRVQSVIDEVSPRAVARHIGNGIEAVEAVPAALAALKTDPRV